MGAFNLKCAFTTYSDLMNIHGDYLIIIHEYDLINIHDLDRTNIHDD